MDSDGITLKELMPGRGYKNKPSTTIWGREMHEKLKITFQFYWNLLDSSFSKMEIKKRETTELTSY
jgi:hypothetical protein